MLVVETPNPRQRTRRPQRRQHCNDRTPYAGAIRSQDARDQHAIPGTGAGLGRTQRLPHRFQRGLGIRRHVDQCRQRPGTLPDCRALQQIIYRAVHADGVMQQQGAVAPDSDQVAQVLGIAHFLVAHAQHPVALAQARALRRAGGHHLAQHGRAPGSDDAHLAHHLRDESQSHR